MEAFDLAVGLWSVGLDREVRDVVGREQFFEALRVGVGPGVVGHHAFRRDAVLGVPGERALGKGDDGVCALVGMQLAVGQARVVVDDRVGVLVPDLLT